MKLIELKRRVDYLIEKGGYDELEVCIPNHSGGGMGGIPTTKVTGANRGIDWNNQQFLLWTEKPMGNIPKQ